MLNVGYSENGKSILRFYAEGLRVRNRLRPQHQGPREGMDQGTEARMGDPHLGDPQAALVLLVLVVLAVLLVPQETLAHPGLQEHHHPHPALPMDQVPEGPAIPDMGTNPEPTPVTEEVLPDSRGKTIPEKEKTNDKRSR